MYCDWQNNQCGQTSSGGAMCRMSPQGCGAVIDRVCGCDGQIHSSPCIANAAGVDIDDLGRCELPAGTFRCGPRFCTQGAQYCQRTTSGGMGGEPSSYSCLNLPPACGSPATCACLAGTACANTCQASASGDLSTTCAFP
jgi:hypothetical protein